MNIVVYAICKDESSNIRKFINSCSRADAIYITDTGSSDNSIDLAKSLGAHVTEVAPSETSMFRFDDARNISLDVIPSDVDVCLFLDLDEELSEGWREALESTFSDPKVSAATVNFVWSTDTSGNSLITYKQTKAHRRNACRWKYPVHEVLYPITEEGYVEVHCADIHVTHSPDVHKERNYLRLLELYILEDSNDTRMLYYLGREYMYLSRYEDSIRTFKHMLSLDGWNEENADACKYLATMIPEEAETWLILGCSYTPNSRDSWYSLACHYQEANMLNEAFFMFQRALCIQTDTRSFIRDNSLWGATIYLNMAKCAFSLYSENPESDSAKACLDTAVYNIEIANRAEPNNPYIIAEYVNICRRLPNDLDGLNVSFENSKV